MALNTNVLNRQPDNFDFARPTQFRFSLLKVPNVEYHVTEVNLPGIAFGGDAIMNTRFTSMPFMGDTLDFSPVELGFMVQENLQNWKEIHDWMTGIGFPKSTEQFDDAITEGQALKNTTNRGVNANPNVLASDATLIILTNKNNPVIKVNFKNMYPTSLSGLTFNTQDTDATPLTAQVTMNYDLYEIEVI
jgi:hypothetical protein